MIIQQSKLPLGNNQSPVLYARSDAILALPEEALQEFEVN